MSIILMIVTYSKFINSNIHHIFKKIYDVYKDIINQTRILLCSGPVAIANYIFITGLGYLLLDRSTDDWVTSPPTHFGPGYSSKSTVDVKKEKEESRSKGKKTTIPFQCN